MMTGVPTKATVSPTIAGKGACPQKIKAVLIAITCAGWIPGRPETDTRPQTWKSACWILWRTTPFLRTRNFPRSHRAQPKETDDTEERPGRTGVQMHREDLLCRDLLSEIVLVGF